MFQKLKNMPIETAATSLVGCNLIPGLLFNRMISTVVGYYFFMLMLLIYRLTTRPVPVSLVHTKTILLAHVHFVFLLILL